MRRLTPIALGLFACLSVIALSACSGGGGAERGGTYTFSQSDAGNVAVSDSLGNEYRIDDAKSQPPQISVAPRSKMRGTAVITRPDSLNAQTLVIKLTKLPFGEATWIVPISGGSQ